MKIYLDFFSGSHGHFLEYVINTWLFKGPRVENIFTPLGASHLPSLNPRYVANRIVRAKHYSEFNMVSDDPDQVIRISITEQYANWIYQINISERAGNIPVEKRNKLIPEEVRNSTNSFRNNWYAKFNFEENGYVLPGNWRWNDIPAFEFPMESLFEISEFYHQLHQLSKFLQITFVPDVELANLHKSFLIKNQGWQFYIKCKNIVQQALSNVDADFESTVVEQALINSMLTRSIGIFDGELFEKNQYPANTSQIWTLIDHHLKTFDQRF